MGDEEAQWLVDNFDHEWVASDGNEEADAQAILVRVDRDSLSLFKARIVKDAKPNRLDKRMTERLFAMLGETTAKWLDLLVWW